MKTTETAKQRQSGYINTNKKDFKILRKKIVTRDKEHFITMKESIRQ